MNTHPQSLPDKAAHIVQAAIDAIYEKGLDQVKLTDVAKQAGVTTGAVTYYFEDKDALLIAAFEWSCNAHLEEMISTDSESLLEPFLVTLPVNRKQRRQWAVWLAFSVRAQTSKRLHRIYVDHYRAAEQTVAEILGITDPERTKQIAGQVIAAMDGVGLCATLNAAQWPADRQRDALTGLISQILATEQGRSTRK